MKFSFEYIEEQNEFRTVVYQVFKVLKINKEQGDNEAFKNEFIKITPQLRQYINSRLKTAIKKGNFSKNKYKADDFIDQLYIELFEYIEELENENDFYIWLYKKTNELLEDTIVEEEFDEYFFKNIDEFSKPEWDKMEEKFSVDGGGDIVMLSELDDMSYPKNEYSRNHIFVENKEDGIIENLDKALGDERIQNHIKLVLHNLPLQMRSVYELYSKNGLSLEEIAIVNNVSAKKAESLLTSAKKALETSLLNRYDKLS